MVRLAAAALALLLPACVFDVGVPEGALRLRCETNSDCPPPLTCSPQGCLPPDVTIPTIPPQSFVAVEDEATDITLTVEGAREPRFRLLEEPGLGTLTCDGGESCRDCDERDCFLTQPATYTPGVDLHGGDSFTFIAEDLSYIAATDAPLSSAPATVTVNISPVNDPPVLAADLSLAVDEDGFATLNVLRVVDDIDDADVAVSVATPPEHGAVTIVDGVARYEPDADYHGPDSFELAAEDAAGARDATAVSVEVASVNDPPTVSPIDVSTGEGTPIDIVVPGADVHDPGEALTAELVSPPDARDGTVEVIGPLALRFTPARRGAVVGFPVVVRDASGGVSDEAGVTVRVGVDQVALAPPAQTAVEDESITITLRGHSAAPFVELQRVLTQTRGTVAIGPAVRLDDGSGDADPENDFAWEAIATYRSAPNESGPDAFSFVLSEGPGQETAPVVVSIDVLPAEDPATISVTCPCPQRVDENDSAGILIRFAVADIDPDDQPSVRVTQGPALGTVTVVDAETVRYVPAPDSRGADTFLVAADDGGAVVAVDVVVAPALTALASVHDVPEDTPTLVQLGARSESPLTFQIAAQPSPGTLQITSAPRAGGEPGLVVVDALYTPGPDDVLEREGTFTITEQGSGAVRSAAVTFRVVPANDAPVADDIRVGGVEDEPVLIDLLPLTFDVDGDELTRDVVDKPLLGDVVIADGVAVYTPRPDLHGTDSFTWSARDPAGAEDIGAVEILLAPTPDAPVASNSFVTVDEDALVLLDLTATDVDGDELVFDLQRPPGWTQLLSANGIVVLSPPPNLNGVVAMPFTARDPSGREASALATVELIAVNDPPTLTTGSVDFNVNRSQLSFALGVTDVDGDVVRVSRIVRQPALSVALTAPASGTTVTYRPLQRVLSATVADSFRVELQDSAGAVAQGDVAVRFTSRPRCEDILAAGEASAGTTTYVLDPGAPGDNAGEPTKYLTQCEMAVAGGGFTLVMRANGTSPAWDHDAARWTDDSNLLNANNPGSADVKVPSYTLVTGRDVILQVSGPAGPRFARVRLATSRTFDSLIEAPGPLPTSFGAETWRWLLGLPLATPPGAGACSAQEGFSISGGSARVRFGALLDDPANGCLGFDTAIGVGLTGAGAGSRDRNGQRQGSVMTVWIREGTSTTACGNGVVEEGEACDDGNIFPGDGCASCVIERCGDLIVNNVTETCDDGNDDPTDGCDGCTAACGDGLLVAPPAGLEECDDANTEDGDGCDSNCTFTACGNGVCATEDCSSCSDDCGSCVECGNGSCEGGETCDSCPDDCGGCIICGDGSCDIGEDCSTCDQDCGSCSSCGDGSCDNGEDCSTCDQDCGTCPFCGDTACGDGEDCGSCPDDCGACFCGDGACNDGEGCDTCDRDCGRCPVCGDGSCEITEDCVSCEQDCGSCGFCGDAACDSDEDCNNCEPDCGACP